MPQIYLEPVIIQSKISGTVEKDAAIMCHSSEKIIATLSFYPEHNSIQDHRLLSEMINIYKKIIYAEAINGVEITIAAGYDNPNKPHIFGLVKKDSENLSIFLNELLHNAFITHEIFEELENKNKLILREGLPHIYLAKNNTDTKIKLNNIYAAIDRHISHFKPIDYIPDAILIITVSEKEGINALSKFVRKSFVSPEETRLFLTTGLGSENFIPHITNGENPVRHMFLLKKSHLASLKSLILKLHEETLITEGQLQFLQRQTYQIFEAVDIAPLQNNLPTDREPYGADTVSKMTKQLNVILGRTYTDIFEKKGGYWSLQKENDKYHLILRGVVLTNLKDVEWYKAKLGKYGIKNIDLAEVKSDNNKTRFFLRIHDIDNLVAILDKNEDMQTHGISLKITK
jgi:hypothetical protein